MEMFHVTLSMNVESILEHGLRPSKCGLDGPGIYLWKGPLETAVREADFSLSDNHYEMSSAEYEAFTKELVMLTVEVPDDTAFTVDWPEYAVVNNGIISPACVRVVERLDVLLEQCFHASGVVQLIAAAEKSCNNIDDSSIVSKGFSRKTQEAIGLE